ncbi:Protein kinase domain-containing protein [Meloidogyne graminicola]|uniref:Protein kinase domain-containing protein n=1 Tax=Meloidogyne graminicola TaxID=189291 RepID=A0A8S9ZK73_9BILA|nr:Protein kinase domain-containing protein [Meloidogyne graminicola]
MNKTANIEANILLRLKGSEYKKHFIKCHKVYQFETTFIVMEYCNGSLKDLIKRLGKLDIKSACTYLAHLIKGVDWLHNLGLMHRDLKPENILAGNFGDHWGLKIADFGISRDVPNVGEYLSKCGTRYYMAPEVLEGHRYDQSADIYSLGGVFSFMLRGVHPRDICFDKCGYPEFTNTFEVSHHSISSRMMCKRKEERLKLNEIIFTNNQINNNGICNYSRLSVIDKGDNYL